MRSWRVRLISLLFTLYTITLSPLYTATVQLDDDNSTESFIDNIDMFWEFFSAYVITAIIGHTSNIFLKQRYDFNIWKPKKNKKMSAKDYAR